MKSYFLSVTLVSLIALNVGCESDSGSKVTLTQGLGDAGALARDVGTGVEVVGRTNTGTKGSPLLLLEERHDSRAGQIQHAITLVRLHEKYSVKDVALEGYLRDGPVLSTSWTRGALHTQDPLARARTVSRLLREGEISSAEFLKLVFDDVRLHPAESKIQYDVVLSRAASVGPFIYLPKLEADSWVRQQADTYNNQTSVMAMRGEQHLAVAEEIERRAQQQHVQLAAAENKAWNDYVAFWRGRVGASNTMVESASAVADQSDVSVVPIIIGSFHTEEMADKFSSSGRPLAVLTPSAIKAGDRRGDLSEQAFDLKYQRKSVFAGGLSAELGSMFPPRPDASSKKPRPVLNETWMQAKSEIYSSTYRLVHRLLGAGGGAPPPPNDRPPYGLSDDDYRGSWTSVNLMGVELRSDKDGTTIVFPITVGDERRKKTLWIKAGLQSGISEGATIEEILRLELDEVQAEGLKMRQVAEDELGRIRMGTDVVAVVSTSREGARRAVLSRS